MICFFFNYCFITCLAINTIWRFFNRQFIKMRFLQYVPKECDIYVFPIRLEKKNVGNNATIKILK